MPEARTLPIAASHREFVVKVNGRAVSRELQLLSVSVNKSVNRIAAARLVFLDGSPSKGDFPQSNDDQWLPGNAVEVLAGSVDLPRRIFTGVIVRQWIKVRETTAPQLIIECRHQAMRLSTVARNASYDELTDAEAMEKLLDAAGIPHEIEATNVKHEHQVQFRCTDWDYLVLRARANGRFVLTNQTEVQVKVPRMGEAVCELQFGASVLELDAEMDGRNQYASVSSYTWDSGQQAVARRDAADPGIDGPGNVNSADIAVSDLEMRHAAVEEAEAQAWVDAQWLMSRLSKVSGRVKCQGIETVDPGHVVRLSGVGKRYNGDVFVTGVRHEFDLVEGWKTHIQFGSVDRAQPQERATSTLLPAVNGLQIGVVVGNEDPIGEHRVRVRLPMVDEAEEGLWARIACLDAGKERGTFFRPELGDEVVVGFLESDPRRAVVLGMLHSSAKPAPLKASDDNHEKLIQTREKLRLYFNDENKVLELSTPAGNTLRLSEDTRGIQLQDQNGNMIEMTPSGITLHSAKALELKAGTEIKLESGTGLVAKAGTVLDLEGGISAKLQSAAATTLKGNPLMLN